MTNAMEPLLGLRTRLARSLKAFFFRSTAITEPLSERHGCVCAEIVADRPPTPSTGFQHSKALAAVFNRFVEDLTR